MMQYFHVTFEAKKLFNSAVVESLDFKGKITGGGGG